MIRTLTLSTTALLTFNLFAASGGPDQYGYTWKDSNEPDGPVFEWIDITGTGIQVTGLADDNVVGPWVMGENFPYYWYSVKKVFIGANGYLAFTTSGNIAAPFPTMPQPGETDNYIAGLMTDLNFSDYTGINPVDNPAECWWYDDLTQTIISYINVPYWSSIEPLFTGSNTFQFVLNKLDSTITINYLTTPCCSGSDGPYCGIEAVNGDIGLQQSFGIYPVDSFSVRFYAPPVPLLDIYDAAVEWVTDETNGARSLAKDGTAFPLHAFVRNTGNQNIGDFTLTSQIINALNQTIAVDATNVDTLTPNQAADILFPNSFVASETGTFRSLTTITGIPNESVTSNNTLTQELVAYDTTLLSNDVDWAGQYDDGIGIGWNGGQAGCGVLIYPPFYPVLVTYTTCRIASNFGNAPFTMRVYDDDGPGGVPGTLLDSVYVDALNAQAGDHTFALANPFMLTEGGVYVLWYMDGLNVNLAQDVDPPFSLRSYEVIQGAWADYRDRETADFHLGLRMGLVPSLDAGCASIDQPLDGQVVGSSIGVRMWLRNYGNVGITGIPCHYNFNGGSTVDQTYNGPEIDPGDSTLFMFAQPLVPLFNATGELCAWTTYLDDVDATNDTSCVNISLVVGVEESDAVQLHMSPVPAANTLWVDGLPNDALRLEVYDMTGALRLDRAMKSTPAVLALNVSALANGAYVLRAVTESASYTGRFVVQR